MRNKTLKDFIITFCTIIITFILGIIIISDEVEKSPSTENHLYPSYETGSGEFQEIFSFPKEGIFVFYADFAALRHEPDLHTLETLNALKTYSSDETQQIFVFNNLDNIKILHTYSQENPEEFFDKIWALKPILTFSSVLEGIPRNSACILTQNSYKYYINNQNTHGRWINSIETENCP